MSATAVVQGLSDEAREVLLFVCGRNAALQRMDEDDWVGALHDLLDAGFLSPTVAGEALARRIDAGEVTK